MCTKYIAKTSAGLLTVISVVGWRFDRVLAFPLLIYPQHVSNDSTDVVSVPNLFGQDTKVHLTLPTYLQTLAASNQNDLSQQRNGYETRNTPNSNSDVSYFMELAAILLVLFLFILYKAIKRFCQARHGTLPSTRSRNVSPTERRQDLQHPVDPSSFPMRDLHIRDTASALSEQGLPSYEEVTKSQEALPSYDEALTHPVSTSMAQESAWTQSKNSLDVDVDDRVQVFTIPVRDN